MITAEKATELTVGQHLILDHEGVDVLVEVLRVPTKEQIYTDGKGNDVVRVSLRKVGNPKQAYYMHSVKLTLV